MKFEKEAKYFKDNQTKLVKRYKDKVLVIRGETVELACDTVLEAYLQGQANFGLGGFAIQRCAEDESAYLVRVATIGVLGSVR